MTTTTRRNLSLPVHFCDGCRRTIQPGSFRQLLNGGVYCVRCSGHMSDARRA